MNIKEIANELAKTGIEQNEALAEAKILVEHNLGLTSVKLAIEPEFLPNDTLLDMIKKRVDTRIPIQYIIGKAYFMGEYYDVNESVLIPRDETEILVRKTVEIINKNDFKKILDVGTGSGCIACSIAKLTDAQVKGLDISTGALQIALDNSSKMGLFNKAIFRKSDIFSNIKANEKFDMIVSNPPYIPIKEKTAIQKEVSFEPESALYAKDDKGIEFYEKIISQAHVCLNPNGYVAFELGIGQSELVKEILLQNNFENIEIVNDLAYIERVITGRMK